MRIIMVKEKHIYIQALIMDYHGKKAICEIRKDEGDILVKNRLGEEKFYRGK